MGREGAGVFVILAGIVVIIGAARGTWRQLWNDVTGSPAPGSSSGGSGSGNNAPPGWIQNLPPIIQNIPASPLGPFGPTIGNPSGLAPVIGGALGLSGYTGIPYTPGPGEPGHPYPAVN